MINKILPSKELNRAGMVLLFSLTLFSTRVSGQETIKLAQAAVYTPLYSHIYHGDRLLPFNLAATVSIRSLEQGGRVTITKADYYDSVGTLVRNLLPSPIILKGFQSHNLKIKESDIEGGSGASVIIEWTSDTPIVPPLVEAIMIGTAAGQGISFTSRGQVVRSSTQTSQLNGKYISVPPQ